MNVPRLRFKNEVGRDFPEWEEKRLQDIFTIKYGKAYKHLNEGTIPVLGTGGVMTYVDQFLYDKPSVLIGRKGTIDKPQFIQEPFWTVDTLFYTEIKPEFSPYFTYLLVSQVDWYKYNEATGVPSLNTTAINNVDVVVPSSLEEQTKIANFLTAIDEKITQLTQKCDLLAQYKKGVIQQIFSQELRFKDDDGQDFPEWGEKKLGELYKITSSKRVFQDEWTKSGVPFYRTREIVKLSENGFVENELYISNEMYSEYKKKYGVPQKDDLLVTGVGTIGKLYVVPNGKEFYFKDGNIIWLKTLNVANSQYVKQLFKSTIVQKQIQDNASITTVGTYTIDSANKTSIPFPSLEEQAKIANFLTAVDEKITLTQTQLNAVKQYKQGLLQLMFV